MARMRLFDFKTTVGLLLFWSQALIGFDSYAASIPLFQKFPSLEKYFPRVEYLQEATPLTPLSRLESHILGHAQVARETRLWIKRDDRSEHLLGGNKARKLEFLMADALQKQSSSIVTSGMFGSNHALATAVASRQLGIQAKLILGPQPISENVRKKLLAFHALGAELRYHGNLATQGIDLFRFSALEPLFHKNAPYYIPPGGSSNLGDLGYVNAFFELLDQTSITELAEHIILPLGSGGTTTGLLVGSCLSEAWEKVQIVGIGVTSPALPNDLKTRLDAIRLYRFIRRHLSAEERKALPKCNFLRSKRAFRYVSDYSQPGYGESSPGIDQTISLLKKTENITLDSTYSGKAMRYLLDRVSASLQIGKTVPKMLFWFTYNSFNLNPLIETHSWSDATHPWRDLPAEFWPIFESPNSTHLNTLAR